VKKRAGGTYRFEVAGDLRRKLGLAGNPMTLDG
jgi:hypothetical protein